MGSQESRLNNLCAVYAYNSNDFEWRPTEKCDIYRTTGIIVNVENKLYVVTTRQRLTGCNNIAVYYATVIDNGNHLVWRNNVQIFRQSIEHNLVILTTVGSSQIMFADSSNISNHNTIENDVHPSGYDLFHVSTKCPEIGRRRKYRLLHIDLGLDDALLEYRSEFHNVKYTGDFSGQESLISPVYSLCFQTGTKRIIGISGTVIVDAKHQPIGIITKTMIDSVRAIPLITYKKCIIDLLNDKYPYQSIPFYHDVTGSQVERCVVVEDYENLWKGDVVKKINGHVIEIVNDEAFVVATDIFTVPTRIPIDIYASMLTTDTFSVEIRRKKKNINVTIQLLPVDHAIKLTNLPIAISEKMPAIPYYEWRDIIFAEISIELLEILAYHDYQVVETNYKSPQLVLIECRNSKLASELDLPCLDDKNTKTPIIVVSIDDVPVSSIADAISETSNKTGQVTLTCNVQDKTNNIKKLFSIR